LQREERNKTTLVDTDYGIGITKDSTDENNYYNPLLGLKLSINYLPEMFKLKQERFYSSFSLVSFSNGKKYFSVLCNIGTVELNKRKDSIENIASGRILSYSSNWLSYSIDKKVVDIYLIDNATVSIVREDILSLSNFEVNKILKNTSVSIFKVKDEITFKNGILNANIKFSRIYNTVEINNSKGCSFIELTDKKHNKYILNYTNDSIFFGSDYISPNENSNYRRLIDSFSKRSDLKQYIADIQGDKFVYDAYQRFVFFSPKKSIILLSNDSRNNLSTKERIENYKDVMLEFIYQKR